MNAAHHNNPAPTKTPHKNANNAAISKASRLIFIDITSLKEGREWLDETTPYRRRRWRWRWTKRSGGSGSIPFAPKKARKLESLMRVRRFLLELGIGNS